MRFIILFTFFSVSCLSTAIATNNSFVAVNTGELTLRKPISSVGLLYKKVFSEDSVKKHYNLFLTKDLLFTGALLLGAVKLLSEVKEAHDDANFNIPMGILFYSSGIILLGSAVYTIVNGIKTRMTNKALARQNLKIKKL